MSHVVRLDFPATHDAVRIARHMVRHFSRLRGLNESERDRLVLVASELLSNAVDHGGGMAAMDDSQNLNGVQMRMELEVGRARWSLAVSDQGGGDPGRLRDALGESTEHPDLEDDRGRGLFLMRASVDRLEVEESEDGRGIRVTAIREHGGG